MENNENFNLAIEKKSKKKNIVIPKGITYLGNYAFSDISAILDKIKNGLKSVAYKKSIFDKKVITCYNLCIF